VRFKTSKQEDDELDSKIKITGLGNDNNGAKPMIQELSSTEA